MASFIPKKQSGKYKAVASGAITNGKPVVVNPTGTVTAAGPVNTPGGGTPVLFSSTSLAIIYGYYAIGFDSNSNKVVIVYTNNTNSYGTAVVGTVSGASISFGTPVVFLSATIQHIGKPAFDSNSNKIVIAYNDNNSQGKAIVGTVSGTNISFGTSALFRQAGLQSTSFNYPEVVFDSNSNKIIVGMQASPGGKAIVGAVSGTGISFSGNNEATFNSSNISELHTAFDSNSNKVVFAYKDVPDSNKGKCVVGTVSGGSISFGTPVVFNNGNVTQFGITFDSNSNKIVVFFRDTDGVVNDAADGVAVVGTVSGTGISFGTPVSIGKASSCAITFDSNVNKVAISFTDFDPTTLSANFGTISGTDITFGTPFVLGTQSIYQGMTFDSNSNKVVVAYMDYGESNANPAPAKAVVFGPTSNNLTAENYIGIASGGTYADTAEATVDVVGTVNKDQTSLTAGQTYFVQADGTLGTSADTISVVAGTAISATELIVKG